MVTKKKKGKNLGDLLKDVGQWVGVIEDDPKPKPQTLRATSNRPAVGSGPWRADRKAALRLPPAKRKKRKPTY